MDEASFHQLCRLIYPQYIHVPVRTELIRVCQSAHISCYPTSRIYEAFLIGIIQLPQRVSAHVAHGAVFMQIGHAYSRPFSCCSTIQQLPTIMGHIWLQSGGAIVVETEKMIKKPDCYTALGI